MIYFFFIDLLVNSYSWALDRKGEDEGEGAKERERARVGLRFMTRARKGGRETESKNRDTSSETPANQDCIPRVSHSKATAHEAERRTSGRHETKGEDGDEAANFPPKGGRNP